MHMTIAEQRFRPHYHFTPRRNWLNDPNGLVWFEGEYHLFYQYNPHGIDWGHMSWGHAVSTDLVTWKELPVAIPEGDAMIFSGSAIVDHGNVSGLGDGTAPPILAYYTEHFPEPGRIERQSLAYSHDRGRTFAQYAGNPLVDIGKANFRDPKVFRHDESDAWIMVVALSQEHCIHIYRSRNLLHWDHASTFGPAGSCAGQWECADLLLCPVDGTAGEQRWVLKVDVDDGFVDGGSGSQYFVGAFDGHTFTPDTLDVPDELRTLDFGPDFYASASWSNLPAQHEGPILIGWLSNQQSGRFYPTDPWRGTMSLPRELFLFEEVGVLRLGQRPVAAVNKLAGEGLPLAGGTLVAGDPSRRSRVQWSGLEAYRAEIELTLEVGAATTVSLVDGESTLLSLTFDEAGQTIKFVRTQGRLPHEAPFARSTETHLAFGSIVRLQIYVDRSVAEFFVNGGHLVYSACMFPQGEVAVEVEADAGDCTVAGQCSLMTRTMLF